MTSITLSDRLAIRDCQLFYGYSMDRGDAEGVASCFTPDGLVVNAAGTRFENHAGIYRFAADAMKAKTFRGRQHHIRPMFYQAMPGGYRVTSYYQALMFPAEATPILGSLGAYVDEVVLHEGAWKMKSKTLLHWDEKEAPKIAAATPKTPWLATTPGGPAWPGTPNPDDRAAIEALMMTYAHALDTADLKAMTATFAPDARLDTGSVGVTSGPAGILAFLKAATERPGFGGRQHRIFPLVWRPSGEGWKTFSYWKVETWTLGKPPEVVGIGYYEDEFQRIGGHWRFVAKTIKRWNSETALMAPSFPPT